MQDTRSAVHSGQSNLYCTRVANESLVVEAIFFQLRTKCSAFVVAHAVQNFFFFFNGISKLLERWTECIAKGTVYVETGSVRIT
jgi:hypothetical protein